MLTNYDFFVKIIVYTSGLFVIVNFLYVTFILPN